jgi:p-hydroxybenzoate 3-monooxygenase
LRTQVAIIGAGPSGLLLSQLLSLGGIDSVVLERRSRAYVEARIRAGVLEPGTVALLKHARAAERMEREALTHDGFRIAFDGRYTRIDLKGLTGSPVTVYGQTEITQDLIAARLAANGQIVFEVAGVALHDFDGGRPRVTYAKDGQTHEIACDFIAGCDGSHGISRASVPQGAVALYDRSLPIGWLGLLSDTSPVDSELIYARHDRGFALCSMRSLTRSRYYLQVPVTDAVEAWPDSLFWDELRLRLPADAAERVATGPSLEKSIAPLRSFVVEPMRFGRLLLAGDAAHIVPPTGAKGLNLAAADAGTLAAALMAYYQDGDAHGLDTYSKTALGRAWRAVHFSWWFTGLTHRLDDDRFGAKLQLAELEGLASLRSAAAALAENYVGRPEVVPQKPSLKGRAKARRQG